MEWVLPRDVFGKDVRGALGKGKILYLSVRRKNEFSFDEFDGSLVIKGATLEGFIFDGRIFVRRMRTPANRLKT